MFIWTAHMANAHAARRMAQLYASLPRGEALRGHSRRE